MMDIIGINRNQLPRPGRRSARYSRSIISKKSNTKKECKFCGKVITGQSITRIKRHWAGVKGGDVLPCPNVLDSVGKSAMEDVQNWEIRQRKEKRSAGRLTDEGPSRPHDSLSRPAHEEPSRHLPSSLGHPGADAITPTKPYNNDDTAASTEWAIQKWFFLNGLPPRHFFASEFHQLCEAFIATKGSSSLHVRLPVASIDDEFILRKLEDEVAGYVRTVRSSWDSTRGCTVCFMDFEAHHPDGSSDTILAAIARCHQGTIFLKHRWIEYTQKDKYKDFLDSIIEDVGLDNITQIFLRRNDLWQSDYATDIPNLLSKDLAYNLAQVYDCLFLYPRFWFSRYAWFIVDICCCVEGLTTLRQQLKRYRFDNYDYEQNVALLVSTMLNEKQTIDGLLGEMQQHHAIANLSFWNSKEAYEEVRQDIKDMFSEVEKDEPTLPTFDEINQGKQKQNMCRLIAGIIAGEDIIPNSVFWKSVEAYICLYKHIHKTARRMSSDSFIFENYLVAYLEAKSIIREEYFYKKDYKLIMSDLDYLLPIEDGAVACYSCPHIRQSIISESRSITIKLRLAKIMGSDANELEVEYASYCEKGNTCSKEVLSPSEIICHSKVWWENQRDRFPHLQKLAIKTLSRRCSSNHIERVINDMYKAMSIVHNYEKLDYLLPIRLNNHFMHIATNSQDDNSALVGTEMVNQHGDFTHQSLLDYVLYI